MIWEGFERLQQQLDMKNISYCCARMRFSIKDTTEISSAAELLKLYQQKVSEKTV